MNQLAAQILAIIAFVVLAMALSDSPDIARVIQAMIVVIILAVLLRNNQAVQDALRNLSGLITKPLAGQATA